MLFDPLTLRGLTIKNRIWLPPMCQYMVRQRDGVPTDWHFVHYGARATLGFGLMVIEATAVVPEGRITPQDLGLWDDAQVPGFAHLTGFAHQFGAAVAVQLAHSGRKGSAYPDLPGFPSGTAPADQGGWTAVGPTGQPYGSYAAPHELTLDEIAAIPGDFAAAARRANEAGIDVIEVHAAHGYLLHQFYSPLSNGRQDGYGGDFAGRTRLTREVVAAVRQAWPDTKPLFVRLSATDWTDGGWAPEDTVRLAGDLKELGVDLIDVSSGGNLQATIPIGPGYQVEFARQVRAGAGLPTTAVGLITEPAQAEQILASGQADAVMIGRAGLREPGWPERAALALGQPTPLAAPYVRGAWPRS